MSGAWPAGGAGGPGKYMQSSPLRVTVGPPPAVWRCGRTDRKNTTYQRRKQAKQLVTVDSEQPHTDLT